MAIGDRFKNAWNAFKGRDPTAKKMYEMQFGSSSSRPDRYYPRFGGEKSQTAMVYNQIAVDCAAININHVRLNENKKYEDTIDSSLNNALTLDANVDQTGRAMMIDAVFSLLDEGSIAMVPVVTDGDPNVTDSFKVEEIRVGKITQWFPRQVEVELYNEDTGHIERVVVDKRYTVLPENPFYMTMNRPNSTAQRLNRVLSQLDRANDAYNPSKLDMIVQVPYMIKNEARRKLAKERQKDIEQQLSDSARGIVYTDATEKIVQLNRSLENNLWTQAKELTEQLYAQLGFTKAIFDGTADESTQLNYYSRTVEPILSAITEEMERKWLSKTARSQGQAIRFFRDPFKLVPVSQLAEMSDKLTRNEIMSSNEIRAVIGLKPDKNPKSDMLINSNLNQSDEEIAAIQGGGSPPSGTDSSFVLDEKTGSKKI